MISLDDRLQAVFLSIWPTLPAIKSHASLCGIGLADLGSRNGSYDPDTGFITLNYRLLGGEAVQSIPLFDITGASPPSTTPFCSRVRHTLTHEIFHAIGAGTGIDRAPAWLNLSGWSQEPGTPEGTARYTERRPGWGGMGPSEWRYTTGGTFFLREYSSRSPFEDQADCCTHIALGWTSFFAAAEPHRTNALAKLTYLRKHVWGETGVRAIHAAAQRWQGRRKHHGSMPKAEQ